MRFIGKIFTSSLFWCVASFLLLGTGLVRAQAPSFIATSYNNENIGLSHNSVLNMTQDSQGFIWLSTMDGLNRFDGKSMKVFRHNPEDSTTLSDSFIHGLTELSNGLFLIGTRDGGINILDPRTEEMTRVSYEESMKNGIPKSPVSVMIEDSEGFLWAGFFNQTIGRFDLENQKFQPVDLQIQVTGERLTSVNSMLELGDGSFLLSSLYGFYFLTSIEAKRFKSDPEGVRSIEIEQIFFSEENPSPNSMNVYVDSNGTLWGVLINGGLQNIERRMIPDHIQQSIDLGSIKTSAERLILERKEVLLIGAGAGHINIIDKKSGTKKSILIKGAEGTVGSAKIFQDNQDNIWFYSWGGGFHYLKEQKGIKLFNNEVTEGNWPANFMLAFEEEDKGLWVGTNNGLAFLEEGEYSNQRLFQIEGFKGVSIWSLERDELGLWIATRDNGLYFISNEEISKRRYKGKSFTTKNSLLHSENVHQVFRDSRGWLWLGYQGGGIQIIKNVESWLAGNAASLEIIPDETNELGILSNSYRRVFEDSNQNIWLATTDQGIHYLKIAENSVSEVTNFNTGEGSDFRIDHNDARNIYQQNDTTFWFSSYGGGITRWFSPSGKLKNFKTNDGLANNSTYGILGDNDVRFLWVSTNNGISRLDTKTLKFTTFTTEDNLQNNEFNTGAYLKRKNGELVFGGVNGFNIINPEELALNQIPPKVYVTNINLFNNPLESDTSSVFEKKLELNHDQNFLSFEFAALNFEKPTQNQYAYMMEGVDSDWVYSSNRTFADYPNLAPGNYTFKVKAANGDGFWNEEGTQIGITIAPPWWQTWWFRTLAILLILSVFVTVIRYLSQRKLREQIHKMEVKNKLRNERERISRDLHDHVGAQLANIISGLSLVDKYNEFEQKEKSSSLMQSLKGDAEITIKQLRETIWALNQNDLTLGAFLDHLKTYFKNQSALNEVLKLKFDLKGDESTLLTSAQALNLFRIIQEASQNTLKYAEASELNISLERQNGSLNILIKDNGTFKSDQESFNGGYGMQNMKKRAAEINATIEVDTEEGTEVKIEVTLS